MKEEKKLDPLQTAFATQLKRKSFLKYTALAGTAAVIGLEACNKDYFNQYFPKNGTSINIVTDVGGGDTGILNFAYALEQLEAAFYTKVNESFYSNISSEEQQILTDIMNHEIVHRDFFKAALGTSAIMPLLFDFSSVNFSDRGSVLKTAKALEDTGVSAYNGAGKYIKSADYLTLAGKIVSVEARHASAIRDLIAPKTSAFAGDDVVNYQSGLDFSRTPNATDATHPMSIVQTANTFLVTKISASKLP